MKKTIITLFTVAIATGLTAQIDGAEGDLKAKAKGSTDSTKNWDKGGTLNVNATQVSLSNWAGGGQNSVSLQGILGLYANYSEGKSAWDNSLDMAYGVIRQGGNDAIWFKNDDRLELNSKYGYQLNKSWYAAALLNFRTQFVEGYADAAGQVSGNVISNLLAPSYTTIALGLDYKPNAKFSAFISPATIKITTLLDDALQVNGAFGVEAGESVRTEFGGYLKAGFVEPKVFGNENLSFKTALSLFSNYQENPQNIDVTWDTQITAKVAKYFNVSLSTNLIYDHDIDIAVDRDGDGINEGVGPRTQFKQVVAVGFAYNFKSK